MKIPVRPLILSLIIASSPFSLGGCGLFKEMAEQRNQAQQTPIFETNPIPYEASIHVEGDGADKSLAAGMEKHSQLIIMKDQLPDGITGLRRRAALDRTNAVKFLRSKGYYDGKAEISVTPADEGKKASAVLTLIPGRRYAVDEIGFRYTPSAVPIEPKNDGDKKNGIPDALPGLSKGDPAEADAILDAVASVPPRLHIAGYPEAKVAETRYTLNRTSKTLQINVGIDPGAAAYMGGVNVSGTEKVDPDYIRKLVTWETGDIWNARKLALFREELQKTGLFRSVDVKPASSGNLRKRGEPVMLPADVEVQESSFRTIGASAKYNSDDGIGVQGEWVHRNLFGAGEKLSLKLPMAQEKQGIQADFEKPHFGSKNRKLLAGASEMKEQTDAYDTTATNGYIGIEQQLSRTWWASVKLFAEAGTVTRDEKKDYHYGSLIFGLRRDTRDDLLNPTSGTQIQLDIAPTQGYYDGNFSGASLRMTSMGYYAPFSNDRLVLAGKMVIGSFYGVDIGNIPPSLRFYSGGGGSVRGYSYQAIGKKDRYGDPLGGRSYQEFEFEARFKLTDTIGIVPFLDGGMVYSEEMPRLFQDIQWAAGLGLRYYTPIGPIRLDVAVPLNRRDNDKAYQFYISIGQAF